MDSMETESARPQPLDLRTWLEAVLKTKSLLEPDEIAISRALRKTFYLSQLAPDPFTPIFATECAEDSFERLLDEGDLQGAACALFPPGLEIEVAKPDGKFIAIALASQIGGTGTGISSHPAAALLEAWFACVSSGAAHQADASAALNRDQHKSLSESHRSSTQH